MKLIFAALASAGLALASGPAFAETPVRTAPVDLSGYDLTDPAQVARAEKRIRSAARKVCSQRTTASPPERDAQAACRVRAETAAMLRLEQRRLMLGG